MSNGFAIPDGVSSIMCGEPRRQGGENARNRAARLHRNLQGGRIETAMHAANNISLPEPLVAEIQSAAQTEHRTVDEVLTDAVQRSVEDRSWTKLLDYGAEQAKALGVNEPDIERLIAESRAEQRGSGLD